MNILQKIIDYKKTEVEFQKKNMPVFKDIKNQAENMPEIKSFLNILESKKNTGKISLIAEVKKASPSKGLIKADFNPVEIAQTYENAGASAISVLTDEKFFQGKIEYLQNIKKEVKIPILRKDFVIDEFQIYQTRAIGADMILLIVSALEKERFEDFFDLSKELGLDVLVEVHNEKEMESALETKAKIIGINNRNLQTFEISLETTIRLLNNYYDKNRFFISESGVFTYDDIVKLSSKNISGILVGESLIKQSNIEEAVYNLMKDKI
ncbi:MAG: indole-3-glycerol phosphate synthase TrpC [Candidatus Gastranaerophilaceae bacterium]|jgi:indole-3-glycerol phosphate synthase